MNTPNITSSNQTQPNISVLDTLGKPVGSTPASSTTSIPKVDSFEMGTNPANISLPASRPGSPTAKPSDEPAPKPSLFARMTASVDAWATKVGALALSAKSWLTDNLHTAGQLLAEAATFIAHLGSKAKELGQHIKGNASSDTTSNETNEAPKSPVAGPSSAPVSLAPPLSPKK